MVQIPVNWFVKTGSIVQCDKICDKLLHLRSCRNHVQDAVPDEQRSVLNNHVRKAKIKIFKNYNFSDFVELDSDFWSSFSSETIKYGSIKITYDMKPCDMGPYDMGICGSRGRRTRTVISHQLASTVRVPSGAWIPVRKHRGSHYLLKLIK